MVSFRKAEKELPAQIGNRNPTARRVSADLFYRSNRSKNRPGAGVELDMKQLKLMAEFTEPITNSQVYFRPDGSITNW